MCYTPKAPYFSERTLAFVTVPLLVTGYVAYRYVKKRRAKKRAIGGKDLDPSLVRASLVYFNLHSDVAASITLPPKVLQSLVRTQRQLPEMEQFTIDEAINAWMAQFDPPLQEQSEACQRAPDALSAALLKLILEDSTS